KVWVYQPDPCSYPAGHTRHTVPDSAVSPVPCTMRPAWTVRCSGLRVAVHGRSPPKTRLASWAFLQSFVQSSIKGPPFVGQALGGAFLFQCEPFFQLLRSVVAAERLPGMGVHVQQPLPQVGAMGTQLPQFRDRLQWAAPAGYPPEDLV